MANQQEFNALAQKVDDLEKRLALVTDLVREQGNLLYSLREVPKKEPQPRSLR